MARLANELHPRKASSPLFVVRTHTLRLLHDIMLSKSIFDTHSYTLVHTRGVCCIDDVITISTSRYISGFRPDGNASFDMGLVQETDGTAWLVQSVHSKFAGWSKYVLSKSGAQSTKKKQHRPVSAYARCENKPTHHPATVALLWPRCGPTPVLPDLHHVILLLLLVM